MHPPLPPDALRLLEAVRRAPGMHTAESLAEQHGWDVRSTYDAVRACRAAGQLAPAGAATLRPGRSHHDLPDRWPEDAASCLDRALCMAIADAQAGLPWAIGRTVADLAAFFRRSPRLIRRRLEGLAHADNGRPAVVYPLRRLVPEPGVEILTVSATGTGKSPQGSQGSVG